MAREKARRRQRHASESARCACPDVEHLAPGHISYNDCIVNAIVWKDSVYTKQGFIKGAKVTLARVIGITTLQMLILLCACS